jgi:hypothetical protein
MPPAGSRPGRLETGLGVLPEIFRSAAAEEPLLTTSFKSDHGFLENQLTMNFKPGHGASNYPDCDMRGKYGFPNCK